MMEGSSTAMGTSRSRPFTTKLSATPSGRPCRPMTFSTMASAHASSKPPRPSQA